MTVAAAPRRTIFYPRLMPQTPPASSANVSARMSRARNTDTGAELALRSALHRKGLRFRVHRRIDGIPRIRPDIVFVSARLAGFVDGCFWHRCPDHQTFPKANAAWWQAKLDRNVERDRLTDAALGAAGWGVLRVWEHEDVEGAARRVEGALG